MLNQFTVLGFISFLNFIASVIIGTFALFNYRKRPVNLAYCVFAYCLSFYAFFYFLWQSSSDVQWAITFFKWCIFGVVLINTAFVHFTYVVLEMDRKHKLHLFIIHVLNVFFCYGSIFLFYNDWKSKYTYGLWPIPSTIFHLYITWWFIQVTVCFYLLYRYGFLPATGKQRKQFQWILMSTLLGYVGGSTNWLVWYDINFPPYANLGVAIYAVLLGYAIFRYQLLGFEVIIKRTLVFAGLFGMVMAVIGTITTLTQRVVGQYQHISPTLSTALSVLIAIILYDPSRKFLVSVTDRFLFQKKEDIKTMLQRLSESIITILELERAGKTILSTLERSLRLYSGAIFIKDETERAYGILDAFGLKRRDLVFDKSHPFISLLVEKGKMINLENPEDRESLIEGHRKIFEDLDAVISIPLFFQKDLIGVLFLGKKKSDQEYTQDEIDYFPTVASQVALALRNARLYDILMKSQIDFAQQAKMATIGTLSAGISHEIKNPLNIIKNAVSFLRFNRKAGLYKDITKEAFEETVSEVLEKIDASTDRATSVIDRLGVFAKKPKEFKIENISIEKALQEPLEFLKPSFMHRNVEVVRKYTPDLPPIFADYNAVTDVFLNLLVNASHAITPKGLGTITVSTELKDGEVVAHVQDTGIGITKENLDKIFDPFFTTKDTTRNSDSEMIKGTGLGLFIVREMIKRFGGRITVDSQVGVGTTFHLFFPVSAEKADPNA